MKQTRNNPNEPDRVKTERAGRQADGERTREAGSPLGSSSSSQGKGRRLFPRADARVAEGKRAKATAAASPDKPGPGGTVTISPDWILTLGQALGSLLLLPPIYRQGDRGTELGGARQSHSQECRRWNSEPDSLAPEAVG